MLINASNAFNLINKKAFLYSVKIICPSIAMFTTNCYSLPSRLFVVGGTEISYTEAVTHNLVYTVFANFRNRITF